MSVDEESTASIDSDVKEPSGQFRPKIVVREEVVEVESDENPSIAATTVEEGREDSASNDDNAAETKADKKSRWAREETKQAASAHKVAMAQPFHRGYQPIVTSPVQSKLEEDDAIPSPDTTEAAESTGSGSSQEKLSRLEEEKAQIQALLLKIDTKQALVPEEESQVKDIYFAEMANKLKSSHQAKKGKGKTAQSNTGGEEFHTLNMKEKMIVEEQPGKEIELDEVEAPEAIEEQTIVEEVVDEIAYDAFATGTVEAIVDESVIVTSQEIPNSKESQRQKEKRQRSLLKKHRKEKERHKRKVGRMRGPSQGVVSSMLDSEEELSESHFDAKQDIGTPGSNIRQDTPNDDGVEAVNGASLQEADAGKEISDSALLADSELETISTASADQAHAYVHTTAELDGRLSSKCESKPTPEYRNTFAVPLLKDNSTPETTPKSSKTDGASPSVQKFFALPLNPDEVNNSSPFTPKSALQVEKSSLSSGRSSTSLTPLTPSPKTKAQGKPETAARYACMEIIFPHRLIYF